MLRSWDVPTMSQGATPVGDRMVPVFPGAAGPGWNQPGVVPQMNLGVVMHLLVVDDDDPVRSACCEIAVKMGFAVIGAAGLAAAREILLHQKVDLVLLDLKSPGGDALALLEEVKTLNPETGVIVMTAYATVTSAVEAMRIGAGDYPDQAVRDRRPGHGAGP